MSCGVHKLCRNQREDRNLPSVGYSVAVSNHMFSEERYFTIFVPWSLNTCYCCYSSKSLPPCLNCILIEMGEMACYQERCPQCGRIPPGRRIQHSPNPAQQSDQMTRSSEQMNKRDSYSKEYRQEGRYSMESISARAFHQHGLANQGRWSSRGDFKVWAKWLGNKE